MDDLFESNSLLEMHLLNLYGPGLQIQEAILDPGSRKISQPVYEDEEDEDNDKTEEEETNSPTDDEEERTCASVWKRVKSMCKTNANDLDTEQLVDERQRCYSLDLSCFNETFNKMRIKASKNPKQHLGRKNETLFLLRFK